MKEKVSRKYGSRGQNHKKKESKRKGKQKSPKMSVPEGIFFEDESKVVSREHSAYQPSVHLSNMQSHQQHQQVFHTEVHHLSHFNFLRLGDRVLRNMLDTEAFSQAMVLDAFYEEKRLKKSKCCNCFNSQCNKKYCQCFKRAAGCTKLCKCKGCQNVFGKKGHQTKTEEDKDSSENNPQSAERIIKQLDKQEPYLNPYSN